MSERLVGTADVMHDVAIVGFGPAGAVLANLLGAAGLSVLVLEKDADIYPLPRAIHFDGEVMRVFQNAGLRAEVEAVSRPGTQGMHFVNANNETLLVRAGTSVLGPYGCASNYYFHQPELERVLRNGVARYTQVRVLLQHEVTDVDERADHVALNVTDHRSGANRSFQARYVVGCDSARSGIRKQIGSAMEDLGLHQPWLVFDAILKRPVDLPDHTVQHCDPVRPMTYCNVTGKRRRWEIMLMPGDDPARMVKSDALWPLVARWVTPEDATLERAVIYTFHSVIAKGWRRGRLLIAGDAAHQTPPFLGQGMCAGIRDAVNLAWKLEAVLRGHASDTLLDTYETERAPHVRAFVELAVRLGDIIQTTDADKAQARDRRFRAVPEIFEFPAPPLGPGLLAGSTAPVGRPFPQPRMPDGRLLDAWLGTQFAVIGRRSLLQSVDDATRAGWSRAATTVMEGTGNEIGAWLDTHEANAVVLRPDRYVLGIAKDAADLHRISRTIPGFNQRFSKGIQA